MIERHVFMKFTPEFATGERVAEVEAALTGALAAIAVVRGVQFGEPADEASRGAWDLMLRVRFDRIEDVEPYRVHPLHQKVVDDYLVPRCAARKAWNFAIGPAA